MKKIKNQTDLISVIAERAQFTKGDVKEILDVLVGIFEDAVKESGDDFAEGKSKILLKVRGLGKLSIQKLPERKGNKGGTLPETTRAFFTLAENIRSANKRD